VCGISLSYHTLHDVHNLLDVSMGGRDQPHLSVIVDAFICVFGARWVGEAVKQ